MISSQFQDNLDEPKNVMENMDIFQFYMSEMAKTIFQKYVKFLIMINFLHLKAQKDMASIIEEILKVWKVSKILKST